MDEASKEKNDVPVSIYIKENYISRNNTSRWYFGIEL